MRYRPLGTTGLKVSEIGFGGFAIGGHDYGPTDDSDSLAALERAWDLGITFYDTADMYGDGRSEELIGRTLGHRESAVLATKVGYVGQRGLHRGQPRAYSRVHIRAAAERSLRRLRREAIDVYQLHNPTPADLETGEAFEAMEELAREGKVRFWGVSAPSRNVAEVCRRTLARPGASTVQLVSNLFHREELEELGPELTGRCAGVIARAPLEYGLLAGKLAADTRFAPEDHRNWRWEPDEYARRLSAVDALRAACKGSPFSVAQLALAFALSRPGVSVVICGAKRPDQVEENVRASELLGSVIGEGELALARGLIR